MELDSRDFLQDINCHEVFHDAHAEPDINVPRFSVAPFPHPLQFDAGWQPYLNQQHIVQIMASQCQMVMTDEQLETLRRQISVYSTICQQLVEMHKAIVAQHGSASALWWGQAAPLDPSLHAMGHKLAARQRWTPSQTQLQILERLFEQESGTPAKNRIKEITAELSQHGQISETNVYNWFQNRRARTKRKLQLVEPRNHGESEPDTDLDSPLEKKKATRSMSSVGYEA